MDIMKTISGLLACIAFANTCRGQGSCDHGGAENDILRITANANMVMGGGKSGDFNHALHGHDPERGVKLQGLELGIFSNLDTYVQAFANMNFYEDDGNVEMEWEEGYLKLHRLPYGFELRGGRMFNLVGTQNNVHLHDWDFIDADLMTASFLGEDGMAINGGELSWYYIYENYGVIGVNLAAGEIVSHGDHAAHSHTGHGHEEMTHFQGSVISLRSTIHHYVNDYNQHFIGLSGVYGGNGYGRDNYLLEMDYTYSWNDKDGDKWGKTFDGSIQVGLKNTEWSHPEDASIRGNNDQLSLRLTGSYGFAENWKAAARAEWIDGIANGALIDEGVTEYAIEQEDLRRFSLACTRDIQFREKYRATVRLQYNWDKRGNEDEHSVWLQLGGGASWSW